MQDHINALKASIKRGKNMQIIKLYFPLLSIFIFIACMPGVQGQFQEQYVTPSSGYSTSASASVADRSPFQFSQFWTMAAEISPGNPISAPQQFQIASNIPTTIYLGEQMQTVPYAQYRLYPAYTGANSLWIAGKTAWTQYAVIPLNSTVSIYAISPMSGSGSLNFVDSNGQTYSHNYLFYQNSVFTFHADTIGRHILSFALNSQTSNQVVIDVASPSAQPSYQEPYPSYYPWYYSEDYYPVYIHSKSHVEKPDRDNKPPSGDNQPPDGDNNPPAGNNNPPAGNNNPPSGNNNLPSGENKPSGKNNPECGPGYHLENGKCVADEANTTA